MYIERNQFDAWMERIMERFDKQDKTLSMITNQYNYLEGERIFDNQQLCQYLNVSKRTLQRYRSSGKLKSYSIHKKMYYKESDVLTFIKLYFEDGSDKKT